MEANKAEETLRLHGMWLRGEKGGVKADLRGAYLRGAYLTGANLSGAYLSGADLREADLSGADLREADLSGSSLRGADLRGAGLSGSSLRGADLREADLSGADLREADLSGSSLRRADLSGSSLRGADLRGAGLSGAVLSGAIGIKYAACYWTAHGECGRQLLAVHHQARDDAAAVTLYYCGCFRGTIAELRAFIANGDEEYKASRTMAADFCEARMREMGC